MTCATGATCRLTCAQAPASECVLTCGDGGSSVACDGGQRACNPPPGTCSTR
jgi:hypothetical protein